jgi:hypothetical protein
VAFFDSLQAFGSSINPYLDAGIKVYSAKQNAKIAKATAKQSAALAAQAQSDNQQLALASASAANAANVSAGPSAEAPFPFVPVIGGVLALGALAIFLRK